MFEAITPELDFTLDCESNGLYGQVFAIGYSVRDAEGNVLERGYAGADPSLYKDLGILDPWVEANVLPHLPPHTHQTAYDVRQWFWPIWMRWKAMGAKLYADCAYPVEAGFLADCVRDDEASRQWDGPYPFHEIASFLAAAGMDPLAVYDRLHEEEPRHHPEADSLQSGRLLFEAKRLLRQREIGSRRTALIDADIKHNQPSTLNPETKES
jgi:hypothetical protein